ncbi:uncharacterized protein LOC141902062 [Tubulanus polymorphus]|uniref:uncharacterized protein LOC141902062 n=1 Tax=Tubulanus polymorphus TaxID=672921 RepID=UPI003DA2A333
MANISTVRGINGSGVSANTTIMGDGRFVPHPLCDVTDPTYETLSMLLKVVNWLVFSVSCFGVCGNLLSFVILGRERHSNNTSVFYLTCLAVADMFICLSYVLFDFQYRLYTQSALLDMGAEINHVMKRMYSYTKNCRLLFSSFSDLITLFIAIDRYIVVCQPLQAMRVISMKKSYIYANIAVIISICDQIKNFFKFTTRRMRDPCTGDYIWVQKMTPFAKNMYVRYYEVFARAPIFTFIPTVIVIVITIRLILTLKSAGAARKTMSGGNNQTTSSSSSSSSSNDRSLTLTLVLISCLYIVKKSFNLAAGIGNLLMALKSELGKYFYYRYFNVFQDLVRMIVASANFFIYCASRRRFRNQLKAIFHRKI